MSVQFALEEVQIAVLCRWDEKAGFGSWIFG